MSHRGRAGKICDSLVREEQVWAARMIAALEGDEAAYARLLKDAERFIAQVVRRRARGSRLTTQDLQDVVQDTLLAVHLSRLRWRHDLPLRAWIATIARNKTIDAMKAAGRRHTEPIEPDDNRLVAPMGDVNAAIDLARIMQPLRPRQREFVTQVMLCGYTAGEVAERLNMTAIAGRVTLHRALRALSASVLADNDSFSSTRKSVASRNLS